MSLFESNLRKQIRNLPKILKSDSVKIECLFSKCFCLYHIHFSFSNFHFHIHFLHFLISTNSGALLDPPAERVDGKISADAAGAPRPSVGDDFQEEICAELSTSAVSPVPLPTNSTALSQLPSGDSPLESEDLSALNSQAFPAVIAAEPVAPLPGTQQVASSAALSTPHSFASASSGMSPR